MQEIDQLNQNIKNNAKNKKRIAFLLATHSLCNGGLFLGLFLSAYYQSWGLLFMSSILLPASFICLITMMHFIYLAHKNTDKELAPFFENFLQKENPENIGFFLYKLLSLGEPYNSSLYYNRINQLNSKKEGVIAYINYKTNKFSLNSRKLYLNSEDLIKIMQDRSIDLKFFISKIDLNLDFIKKNIDNIQLTVENLHDLQNYKDKKRIIHFLSLFSHINERLLPSIEKIIGLNESLKLKNREQSNKEKLEKPSAPLYLSALK